MPDIKCSVIVPEYNNGRFFADLYKSIVRQTYTNWELIVADDCSTDITIELIHPYLTDTRLKLIRHPHNLGGGAAFKTATEHSTGEIVALLGADDALVENAIEQIVKKHQEHPEASLVFAKLINCDENLVPQYVQESFQIPPAEKTLLEYSSSSGFQSFKRSYYDKTEGFDPYFKRAIDQDLNFKMEEAGKIVYLDMPLYLYRRMHDSISQGKGRYLAKEFYYRAIFKAYERRKKNGYKNLTLFQLIDRKSQHNYLLYKVALDNKKGVAVIYLLKSIVLNPTILFRYNHFKIIFYDFIFIVKDLFRKRK